MKDLKKVINNQRKFFDNGETINVRKRIQHLKLLKKVLKKNKDNIFSALKSDLGKPNSEIWLAEINVLEDELNNFINNLKKWSKIKKVKSKWYNFPSKDFILPEPYGCTLHIAPWNYPFQLALTPLVGAVGAGNTVILKPSEHASKTGLLIKRIIEQVFDKDWVYVAVGGPELGKKLLTFKWDYIFFTGGVEVGKIVAKAAAKNLTPITLELGGKNPCIVDETANISVSARRIVWGKFMNCGQICMAPDYLLLSNKIFEKFIAQLKIEIIKMFGKNPIKSNDYGRIIHKDHLDKMKNLIKGQNVIYGGKFNDSELYFEPTIILINSKKNLIMESEIFGPILPIIKYTEESEIKQIIKSFNKPLSFYVFSNRKRWAQNIMQTFSFGGGMINDVIVYFTNERLPFGGVGNSGIGRYHGKFSFETFSHFKPIVKRYTLIDPSFRYPPYGKALSILKKLLSFRFFLM